MQDQKIHFSQFKPENLFFEKVISKKSQPAIDKNNPAAGPVQHTYYEIDIRYKYEIVENGQNKEIVDALRIEGCECFTNQGIVIKSTGDRRQASLLSRFDCNRDDVKNFVLAENSFWKLFYIASTDHLFKNKANIPAISKIVSKAGMEGAYTNPIYFPRNDVTGEVFEGKNPSRFFDLNMAKENSLTSRGTPFSIPTPKGTVDDIGNPIYNQIVPWDILTADKNVKFSFVPVILIDKIMITSKVALRAKILSAVITEITKSNNVTQNETLQSMQQNEKLLQSVQYQVASLTSAIKNSLTVKSEEPPKSSVQQQNLLQPPSSQSNIETDKPAPNIPIYQSVPNVQSEQQQNFPSYTQQPNVPIYQPAPNVQNYQPDQQQNFQSYNQQPNLQVEQTFNNPNIYSQHSDISNVKLPSSNIPSIIPKPINNLTNQLNNGPVIANIPTIPSIIANK